MVWWHWLVIGLTLIALEIAVSGGFYVIFFGIAALAIGALHAVDFAGPVWVQFLTFSVISVGSLVLFRNPLIRWLKLDAGAADVDTLVGEPAAPLDEIAPGAVGRAELRGTVWTARNAGTSTLARAQRCTVVAVDRLVISIKPEGDARI
jgi:membrane protein implicated in regulation of membrane protease activity